jgi:pterin-4a-carbinolamine dehydratase
MNELINRHCNSNPEFAPQLDRSECEDLMVAIDKKWDLNFSAATLSRRFKFNNYYQTIAYANSIDSLSVSDFIRAARIDALMH